MVVHTSQEAVVVAVVHDRHSFHSIGVGSRAFLSESDVYKNKDLSLVKEDSLPTSAAEYHAWKNTFLTKVSSIDKTGDDVILGWLLQAFDENIRLTDLDHSGLLPRLDAHIGSLLMESKHLKGELGMKFQTYAESCQANRRAPRGKSFLFMKQSDTTRSP